MGTVTRADLYWLLKLDDFRDLLTGFSIVAMVAGLLIVTVYILVKATDAEVKFPRGTGFAMVALLIFSWSCKTVQTALPSTKQAAVIYAGPSILNNDAVRVDLSEEARQVYSLAKQWLENAVDEGKKHNPYKEGE